MVRKIYSYSLIDPRNSDYMENISKEFEKQKPNKQKTKRLIKVRNTILEFNYIGGANWPVNGIRCWFPYLVFAEEALGGKGGIAHPPIVYAAARWASIENG